jgi:hypothetical protein
MKTESTTNYLPMNLWLKVESHGGEEKVDECTSEQTDHNDGCQGTATEIVMLQISISSHIALTML